MDKLYTIRDVAELFVISRNMIYKSIKASGIIPIKLGPRSNRLTQEQIEDLMDFLSGD